MSVESFLYYLSIVYKDFVVYYQEGDPEQVKRLAKNVEVRKYTQPIECENFFCNYNYDIEVKAKNYYHIIHYDALGVKFKPMQIEDWKYIGVSKLACESFEKVTGRKCELIYNVIPIKPKKLKKYPGLNLISATRLTLEKGLDRIVKLSNALDKARIEYTWTIYTNKDRKARSVITSKNVIVKPQQLDIHDEIEKSSFLVQLSDTESFGLSVCESLILGTPVIITDLDAFTEIGCNNENSIKLDLDMNNIPIETITKRPFKFKYEPPFTEWHKYLSDKSDYDPLGKTKVKALRKFTDIYENKLVLRGEEYSTTYERASYLESKDFVCFM